MESVIEEKLELYLRSLHKAAEVSFDNSRPIRFYTRSASSVFRQACIYKSEGDLEKAFILFLKYSNLVLTDLPKHPEYISTTKEMASLRGNLVNVLDMLEQAKPILLDRYKMMEMERMRIAQRGREMEEARRRDQEARELAEKALHSRREKMEELRRIAMERSKSSSVGDIGNERRKVATATPAVINNKMMNLDFSSSNNISTLPSMPNSHVTLPPQSPIPSSPSLPTLSLYPKLEFPSLSPPLAESTPKTTPKYYSENGMPLRSVHIPIDIIEKFLQIASTNTRKDLETCGVLAGTLSHDQFTLTHLLIPKQTSTSDTVCMLNEEEIFAIQDENELLTLGWIHTHPSQQCFMSSVDLHTQFPYQLLLAEAIAIVVAPTQSPNFGIFRLTDPPGVGVISDCPKRGFHHHTCDGPIYCNISGVDGHAKLQSSLPLTVIDLRT